jgi:hypothetical protein
MIPRLNSARFAFWYAHSWLMRRWSGTTQSDEAAILGRLTENAPYRTFLEFGFHPLEFNCIRLAADPSWRGLVVDADATMIAKLKENASLGNTQAAHSFLTLENLDIIRGQFDHLGVLSIDVDGNDYWFLKALIDLSPSIICVEYNSSFGLQPVTVPYDAHFDRHAKHPSGWYHGASLTALCKLAHSYDYGLAAVSRGGSNAFFTRDGNLNPEEAWRPSLLRRRFSGIDHEEQWDAVKNLDLITV